MIKIKVLYIQENFKIDYIDIENNLHTLQGLVGGYIQAVPLDEDKQIVLICDDEGLYKNYPVTAYVIPIEQYIRGNFIVCQYDESEFTDLEETNLNYAKKLLA